MTLPPVIRIFFAIDLPIAVKQEIGKFIGVMKKRAKKNAIRWTKPENLHITLHFLAQVHTEHLAQLLENVRTKVKNLHKKPIIKTVGLHLFPNPYRPRVIVLELNSQEQLNELVDLIGQGIQLTQYKIEERPFRAHLTLGRIKYPRMDLNFLSELPIPSIEQLEVNEVILFRSEPQSEGSLYTPIDKIALSTK